jgi:hypothetical protein
MYFANVQYIHDRLRKYVGRAAQYSEAGGMPLQYLLLDMSPVTHIDSTGGCGWGSVRRFVLCVKTECCGSVRLPAAAVHSDVAVALQCLCQLITC